MADFVIKTREKTITVDGYAILYGLKHNATPEDVKKIKDFFRARIYKNAEIARAKPGYYTWILKSDGNFYAAKTFTKQELGTLHINLKTLTNSNNSGGNTVSNIISAGEMEIVEEDESKTVIFNLLSGTFMAPQFWKKRIEDQIKLRNELVSQLQTILFGYGLPSQFLECTHSSCSKIEKVGGSTLIDGSHILTEPSNIAMLNTMFERRSGGYKRKRRTRRKTRYAKKYTIRHK